MPLAPGTLVFSLRRISMQGGQNRTSEWTTPPPPSLLRTLFFFSLPPFCLFCSFSPQRIKKGMKITGVVGKKEGGCGYTRFTNIGVFLLFLVRIFYSPLPEFIRTISFLSNWRNFCLVLPTSSKKNSSRRRGRVCGGGGGGGGGGIHTL